MLPESVLLSLLHGCNAQPLIPTLSIRLLFAQAMACMLPTLLPGTGGAAVAMMGSSASTTTAEAAVTHVATAALMTHVDAIKARVLPQRRRIFKHDGV